jgi:hypothetical protein
MGEANKVLMHYWNLEVPLTEGTRKRSGCNAPSVGSSVVTYRNLNYIPDFVLPAKNDLLQAYNGDKDADKPSMPSWWYTEAFMAVYSGEGSPEEISAVLTLVGHYAAKKTLSTALPVPVSSDMEACLRGYTAKFIGLDCLGLISNCANAIYGDHGLYRSPATITNKTTKGSTGYGVMAMAGDRITSSEHITPNMGMIYVVDKQPAKHGVMIDVATSHEKIWRLEIVESLGEETSKKKATTGPRQSVFEVDRRAVGPIFKARRQTRFESKDDVFIVRYHG